MLFLYFECALLDISYPLATFSARCTSLEMFTSVNCISLGLWLKVRDQHIFLYPINSPLFPPLFFHSSLFFPRCDWKTICDRDLAIGNLIVELYCRLINIESFDQGRPQILLRGCRTWCHGMTKWQVNYYPKIDYAKEYHVLWLQISPKLAEAASTLIYRFLVHHVDVPCLIWLCLSKQVILPKEIICLSLLKCTWAIGKFAY